MPALLSIQRTALAGGMLPEMTRQGHHEGCTNMKDLLVGCAVVPHDPCIRTGELLPGGHLKQQQFS